MSERWHVIKRWLWRGAKIALLIAAAGAVVYWLNFSPVAVKEHRLGQGEIVAEVMGTGTFEARTQATISPKIAGRVKEVLFDLGETVSKGSLATFVRDFLRRPFSRWTVRHSAPRFDARVNG